jgi:hypothetical protein
VRHGSREGEPQLCLADEFVKRRGVEREVEVVIGDQVGEQWEAVDAQLCRCDPTSGHLRDQRSVKSQGEGIEKGFSTHDPPRR